MRIIDSQPGSPGHSGTLRETHHQWSGTRVHETNADFNARPFCHDRGMKSSRPGGMGPHLPGKEGWIAPLSMLTVATSLSDSLSWIVATLPMEQKR